jgi:hypothetical protein
MIISDVLIQSNTCWCVHRSFVAAKPHTVESIIRHIFCCLQGLLMFTSLEVNNRKVMCYRMLKIEFNDPQENLLERTKLHVSFERSEDTYYLLL